ncbi:MAG: hypothetical protein M9963_03720 [Kiritimatiellae bacterium]|nr:hypothetical protein [Kiritimatiellia bacterium]
MYCYHFWRKVRTWTQFFLVCLPVVLAFTPTLSAARPPVVDLRQRQTEVKAQTRGNCFIYTTVAAMEAQYKALATAISISPSISRITWRA